jgi:hypothetical protein
MIVTLLNVVLSAWADRSPDTPPPITTALLSGTIADHLPSNGTVGLSAVARRRLGDSREDPSLDPANCVDEHPSRSLRHDGVGPDRERTEAAHTRRCGVKTGPGDRDIGQSG